MILACLLAIGSGLLYFLGFAGSVHFAIAWVALVPLFFALAGRSLKQSFFLGWIAGVTAHLFGFSWLMHTLMVFGQMSWPVAFFLHLLIALAQSAQFGVFAWLLQLLQRRRRSVFFLVAPIAWCAVEFLYPHLFPSYFANSQYRWTPVAQIADITGVHGISFLLVCVNAAVYLFVRGLFAERRFVWKPLLGSALALVFALVYGRHQIGRQEALIEQAAKLRVGIVQANIAMNDPAFDSQRTLERHLEMSRPLEEHGLDLIIWPEGVVDEPVLHLGAWHAAPEVTAGLRTPLLAGVIAAERHAGRDRLYNAAALITPDQRVQGVYLKQILLMFGDYIPFGDRFPGIYELFPQTGRFAAGHSNAPLRFNGVTLGMSICYEDILPRLIRQSMRYEPRLLVNITNDSWFGDTREPLIHLALATFRAVEHRRALVRATTTGISALVDPLGRIVQRTPQFQPAVLIGAVPLMESRTLYTRFGDWFAWACLGLAALCLALPRRFL